ncbi:MAG: RNA polymerase factor sigma-54 [Candidatus Kapaibacterium sp.]
MKLSLDLKTSLSQTLTPQQIQYLKLLQLPLIQMEQQVRQEIEQNPMLEEAGLESESLADENEFESSEEFAEAAPELDYEDKTKKDDARSEIPDDADPFEFYKMIWEDDSGPSSYTGRSATTDEDEFEPYQIKDLSTFSEDLINQLQLLYLTDEQYLLGEQIIGNIGEDGYLRRELEEIVDEANEIIADRNLETIRSTTESQPRAMYGASGGNPALQYALDESSSEQLRKAGKIISGEETATRELPHQDVAGEDMLKPISMSDAEYMLDRIQQLDPPGVGSRNLQECLVSQLKVVRKPNAAQKLALQILTDAYEPFTKKHYSAIMKQLDVTEDYLKEAIDVIRRLNPKPGGGEIQSQINTVIPDFSIERDEKTDELMITVNDSRIPQIQLSTAYDKLKKEAKFKHFNKDTRDWIRNKYEDAKFLIQAIRQRKNTMLKVMTAIAGLQRDFFEEGPQGLKPLIYKNVAEKTGLDISTVCRIVNGKYVQTEYGTFELKYFFSEALPTDQGEEVSTRIIKQKIRDMVAEESKTKPLSDEKISKELKKSGYNVARRTVAKYREQMRIPVARLRKEL